MKTYKRLSILCIAVLLCALLPVLAGATSPGDPPEAVDTNAVYVRANGNDNGAGSQEDPYATLAKAVEKAAKKNSATIYVMSNLTMSECARFWTGDITITSAPGAETPYTIFRGKNLSHIDENESVDPVQDMARGGYNPALIEVGNSASLTLENIILNDGHIMAYTYTGEAPYATAANPVFVQVDASRGGNVGDGNPDNNPGSTTVGETNVSNFEIVQDAIIATYSGDATITLGNGAVLQNYGGMSAVRVSGGTLVMESGSKICDSDTYTRIKGATDSDGPAGAVWVQSGKVEMQEGASIENMNGRAIYEDGAGSDVTVDGTISGITGNSSMWQGNNGTAIYLRNMASAVITENCEISEVTGASAVYLIGNNAEEKSKFRMQNGAKIYGLSTKAVQQFQFSEATIDGELYGFTNTQVIHLNSSLSGNPDTAMICTIGSNAYIHDNTVNYGAVYVQGNGAVVHIYGKINHNHSTQSASAICLSNNQSGKTAYLYDGAEICNNTATRTNSERNGAVYIGNGAFIMEGGNISNNVSYTPDNLLSNAVGAGVDVGSGGTFTMENGNISNNATNGIGGGLTVSNGVVVIKGGNISDNVMNATITTGDYTASGGTPNDVTVTSSGTANISRYLTISDDVTLSEESIYMQSYDYTIERPREGVKLGNASANGETALKTASENLGWEKDKLIASFWAQSASNETWELNGLTKDNAQLPVYALVMPTDPEGNVAGEAEAAVYAVTIDGDTWRFAVPAGETNGYVVGLVQPTEDYGTLALTVSPTQVTEGEDSHTFQYQAVYTISGSLKNMLDQEPNVGDFTLTFVLDSNLTCTDANDANYDSDTHTLTVTVSADKLDGYTFHFSAETADGITLTAGDQLVTSAVLSGQVGMTQVTVPSAPAVVEVVAQTPVTPPVTPSEPADPDDTGVSDLLDTENHNQYLFGYPEGTFGPDQNMTRAEVAQMFYNLLVDKNVAITASFEDVPADAWYAKSVNTLASMGIISGVGENRFEPERSITRAEFTSMAMKFTKGALDGTNIFSDVHSGDWFYEAVVGSIQYGWIEGYEDGTFRPENWITRVEVTSIVNKMLGRFADREFVAGHADELNAFSDVTSTHWGYYHIVEATNSHTYTKPSTNVETWTELK
ncbi:S-layer homology domain-containing protein [Acutalibacter sp. LFL-21]|uniref:S-layer homology domain-containing protein n=1 Tax=Acutalibacter sp. LFL-21 TaxID=2983399 RepID=UPI0021D69865|nr:S-layer homology domain-containing protein [Acutalibacter sp. LFL-21]MCU7652327.1 S-layer homology domain-containing protein [Acutalibacter sp. LFL-21]